MNRRKTLILTDIKNVSQIVFVAKLARIKYGEVSTKRVFVVVAVVVCQHFFTEVYAPAGTKVPGNVLKMLVNVHEKFRGT